jgi:hypothetical protein
MVRWAGIQSKGRVRWKTAALCPRGANLLKQQRADGDTEERHEGRNTEAGEG